MHWLVWIAAILFSITIIYVVIKKINNNKTTYELIAVMAATPEELLLLEKKDLINIYNRVRKLNPPYIFKDRVIFQAGMVSTFKKLEEAIELKKNDSL
jgi:hypothetical protein